MLSASGSEREAWTAPDKQAHALVGFAFGTVWATALDQIPGRPSKMEKAAAAVVPLLALAVGKELWDRKHPSHDSDARDALATIAGGAVALTFKWSF